MRVNSVDNSVLECLLRFRFSLYLEVWPNCAVGDTIYGGKVWSRLITCVAFESQIFKKMNSLYHFDGAALLLRALPLVIGITPKCKNSVLTSVHTMCTC